MKLLTDWVSKQSVKGMTYKVLQDKGRTPILFIEVAASEGVNVAETGSVLMYGHMDKQPPFKGWTDGLGPYTPVIKDGKLYGRGGADDGYATFCAVLSLKALQKYNIPHPRVVILVEASEESGSPDLEHYVTKLKDEIGSPNLVVCLDSGCGNYDQLWLTASLRGCIGGTLSVKTLKEGVHSGDSSGVIPGTFRILRQLLSRIEDPKTGEVFIKDFQTEISEKCQNQVKLAAETLGKQWMCDHFPFLDGVKPVTDDVFEMALNRWWKPQLVITGQEGLPNCEVAGNVMRPETKFTLSLRLPPTVDAEAASLKMKEILEKDPPYGAHVTFTSEKAASGFAAPELSQWLEKSIQDASTTVFNKPCMIQGSGGSIPFMGMLLRKFPKAQFCVMGLLGPYSNAHGPNESMDIDYAGGLCCCCSMILNDHSKAKVESTINSK